MASAYATNKGLRWRATWTDNGRQRSKGGFRTSSEAEDYEKGMREERELEHMGPAGIEHRARTTKVSAWLLIWWELYVERLVLNTRESYAEAVNDCIDPYIGDVTLFALTPPRIARWRDDMLEDGVTPRKVIQAMRALSAALTKARERGYVMDNHCMKVSKPSPGPGKLVDPLIPEDVERIRYAIFVRPRRGRFNDLDALRSATIVSLAAYGGLRPEDLWGLRATDVDFESCGVWVRGVMAAEYRANDDKTHTGGRFVDLPPQVMDDLAAYLAASHLQGAAWLFPDENGDVTRWTHRNWTARVWRRARQEAATGAPDDVTAQRILRCTPYELRHSCVSVIAQAEGADLDWADLAARMGHGVDVMRKTYLHVVRAYKRRGRVPVEQQIAMARASLGVDVAAASLHQRLEPAVDARKKLINLQAVRTARRTA